MKRLVARRGCELWLNNVVAAFCFGSVAGAQIVLDGSLGPARPLTGPSFAITADLGRQIGPNLFHSFSQFNLATGEAANFSGPPEVRNIVSRVTGGSPSSIDGMIKSDIVGANFFLLNPAGVMFGPNAALDVSGSFVVSTADYVKLAGGGRFDAVDPARDILTTAPPSAFGFLTPQPQPITFHGTRTDVAFTRLNVTDGKTLSLVGGDIRLGDCELLAPGGHIDLISVGSEGEVPLDVDDLSSSTDTSQFSRMGNITLSDKTFVNASPLFTPGPTGPSGGKVVVRAENLSMTQAALQGFVEDQDGLGVDIDVRQNMVLEEGFGILTSTSGTGQAGDIHIRTGSLQISSAAGIESSAVLATGGNAGEITIDAQSILIDGRPQKDGASGATGIFALTASSGNAGNVILKTRSLELKDGGLIDATTKPDPIFNNPGNGGNISVTAERIQMSGTSSITTSSESGGQGGAIKIVVGDLVLDHESKIRSTSISSGASGSIKVDASASIRLTGGSQISTEASVSLANGITIHSGGDIELHDSQVSARAAQDGGNTSLTSPSLVHLHNSVITAEAGGNGGNITIDPQFLVLNNSRVTANAIRGNGGNIFIATSQFFRSAESLVTASSEFGLTGEIAITAPDLDLTGSLSPLLAFPLGAESRLPEYCGRKLTGGLSSFIVLGQGGLALDPGAWQPSFDFEPVRKE